MASRWDEFTTRECSDIHHALRMICKHPMVGSDERALFTQLADEVWGHLCTKSAQRYAEQKP